MTQPSSTRPAADSELQAFISYSRQDSELAARLQSRLQSFAKPWYRLRRLNVFRDASHLVSGALRSSIEAALDRAGLGAGWLPWLR
jgi:hypothetical protein